MLTTFFVQARVCARLEAGPLGSHLETLIATLQTQGDARSSIRQFLRNTDAFARWLAQQGLALDEVDEASLNRYLAALRRSYSSRESGQLPKSALGLKQVLKVLRQHGLVQPQPDPAPVTEAEQWLRNFDHHLEYVLGFSPGTRCNYLRYARRLIDSRFGPAAPDWAALSAQDVTDFVRREAGKLKSSTCRQQVGAIKALLRFLAISGLVPAGLAGAVPPIREWRQASLSTHLSTDELARVLTVGETDERGFNVTRDPVHVHDLHATILHLLGFDHERSAYRFQGRDFRLTDMHGIVHHKLLAWYGSLSSSIAQKRITEIHD